MDAPTLISGLEDAHYYNNVFTKKELGELNDLSDSCSRHEKITNGNYVIIK